MKATIERCEKTFRRIAKRFGISYGTIFGSASIGRMREDSNLDIAVKLKADPNNMRDV